MKKTGLDLMDPTQIYNLNIEKMSDSVRKTITGSEEFKSYVKGLLGGFDEDELIAAFLFTEDYIKELDLKFYIMIEQREDHVVHFRDELGYIIVDTSMGPEIISASGEYSDLESYNYMDDTDNVPAKLEELSSYPYPVSLSHIDDSYDIKISGMFSVHEYSSMREKNLEEEIQDHFEGEKRTLEHRQWMKDTLTDNITGKRSDRGKTVQGPSPAKPI